MIRPGWFSAARKNAQTSRDPLGLLHVVGDDDHGDVVGDVGDRLLDPSGGGGVEGRARLVHQQDPGLDRQGAGDAQALLLAPRQGAPELVQPVLDLVPQSGLRERHLDQRVTVALWRMPENLSPDSTLS